MSMLVVYRCLGKRVRVYICIVETQPTLVDAHPDVCQALGRISQARRGMAPGRDGSGRVEADGGHETERGGRGGRGEAAARSPPSGSLQGGRQVRELIAEALAEWGLVAEWVVGDGNCLFRALSVAVAGDENQHQQMRAGVCEYMMTARGRRRLGIAVGGWDNVPRYVR